MGFRGKGSGDGARRHHGVRWSTLTVATVAVVLAATWLTVAAVRASGVQLLDQVAQEEAVAAATAVASVLEARAAETASQLDTVIRTPDTAARLSAGDTSVCASLTVLASGASGVVLDAAGQSVCPGVGNPSALEEVSEWFATLPAQALPTDTTLVWFSPGDVDNLMVSATPVGDGFQVLRWAEQDSVLRSLMERLGPRNVVLAFSPTGADLADVVLDIGSGNDEAVRSSSGFVVPEGRAVGPLDVDAFWASASTSTGAETVSVAVDPAPYDDERRQLSEGLAAIAAAISGVAVAGVAATLWWTNRSIRRLGDGVDAAADGVFASPLPASGPRETRRIASALERLGAAQVASDVAAVAARREERARIVTTLDSDVATVLDDVADRVASGATFESQEPAMDLVARRLRGVLAMLHPAVLYNAGLSAAAAEQVSSHPGWELIPGTDIGPDDVSELVAGLLYSVLTELWYRNPSGRVSLGVADGVVHVEVSELTGTLSQRWEAPLAAIGATVDVTATSLSIAAPTSVKEFT